MLSIGGTPCECVFEFAWSSVHSEFTDTKREVPLGSRKFEIILSQFGKVLHLRVISRPELETGGLMSDENSTVKINYIYTTY